VLSIEVNQESSYLKLIREAKLGFKKTLKITKLQKKNLKSYRNVNKIITRIYRI